MIAPGLIDKGELWVVMAVLGLGTYAIRFSFLGVLGNRRLPLWLERALRYTAVAVLPALVAPAVLWPAANSGQTDPARLAAALATVLVGCIWRSMMAAIVAGGLVLYLLPLVLVA